MSRRYVGSRARNIVMGNTPTWLTILLVAVPQTVIVAGKRDEDCEALEFAGWPPHSRASWFDNGFERVYQISLRR